MNLLRNGYFSDSVEEKKAHYHDCHQIILILKGNVQFYVNNAKHEAQTGNVLLFSRYENHSVCVLSDEYERFVLHLDPKGGRIESRAYSLLSNRSEGFCNVIDVGERLSEFNNIFCRVIDEYNTPKKLTEDMMQLLINELLIMIYRMLPNVPYFNEMVYDIQRRFENNYNRLYTLDALAKQYNVSSSTLSHQFKKNTGSSVMEYLLFCRITEAKRMLVYTDFSVGQIVENCGFSDNSNFSRIFKKLNGISPSDFRKKYKAR